MGTKRYIFDILILSGLILLVSWVFRRADPGWFQFQQASIWLIIPLLAGGRYGFVGGLLASAFSGVAATVAQVYFSGANYHHLLSDNPGYYVALLVTGALTGLTHRMVEGSRSDLEGQILDLSRERDLLSANNLLYRENEAQLQSALASHQIAFCSMTRAADLVLQSPQPVEEGLLPLIQERFGLRSAALYRSVSGSERFERVSVLGPEAGVFADSFDLSNAPVLMRTAVERGELVTCRSLWPDAGESMNSQPFLAALPGKDRTAAGSHRYVGSEEKTGVPNCVLLIRDMEFENITWENFARMEAIFDYVIAGSVNKKTLAPS